MGMQSEIHRHRTGTQGCLPLQDFQRDGMSTNSSIDAEILNSGTLQKSVHII